jgi:FkbM family methyltransferase
MSIEFNADPSLVQKLKAAVPAAPSSRWMRLLRSPVKTALPPVLRQLNRIKQVEVDTFFGGRMTVVLPEAVSTVIWRNSAFEADVCMYLMNVLRPGDTFMDIGGHFGFFSMLGQHLVGKTGRTITFEPMPATRSMLTANLAKAVRDHKPVIIPAAAGAQKGEIEFKDLGLAMSAYATSGTQRTSGSTVQQMVKVPLETLDNVAAEQKLQSLRLIKIDAENAELEVLKGAVKTIDRLRPAIIVEVGDVDAQDTHSSDVVKFLKERNYNAYDFVDWQLKPHIETGTYTYGNILFVPA